MPLHRVLQTTGLLTTTRSAGTLPRGAISRLSEARAFAGLLALLLLLGVALPALAAEKGIPRFASLRAERVNVRSGPGVRYPIAWVFVRRGLPIEITAEFEFWRKVRDWDGSEGWVHQSLIGGSRTALVTGAVRALRLAPLASSSVRFYAEPGVQGEVLSCRNFWCEMRIAGRVGWIQQDHLWGVHPNETFE